MPPEIHRISVVSSISTGWLPSTHLTGEPARADLASAIWSSRAAVIHGHDCAMTRQPARRRLSLAGASENGHTFAVPVCFHHRSYTNAKPTPSMAASRPISQKRCTIWVSDQPSSSKCRWMGAILKKRRPWVILK